MVTVERCEGLKKESGVFGGEKKHDDDNYDDDHDDDVIGDMVNGYMVI